MFGPGGISIWQLLIILVIIVLLFGTKKLRNTGGDLGAAIKSFRKSVKDDESQEEEAAKSDSEEVADSPGTEAKQEKA